MRAKNILQVWLSFLFVLLSGIISTQADPHYVVPTNAAAESPYDTWDNAATNIQHAVNAAANNETVLISNGTYFCSGISTCIHDWYNPAGDKTNTAMVVITNAITVRSVNGYSNTIVDGNWPAWTTRVFLVNNTGAVLSGLTITNGYVTANPIASVGVGIYAKAVQLITNCLITGNVLTNDSGWLRGAGICMDSGTVSHCIIQGNKVRGVNAHTPGIFLTGDGQSGARVVTNCLITDNSKQSPLNPYYVKACYAYYGNTKFTHCVITGNTNVGAIHVSGSSAIATWCIISNNYSDTYTVQIDEYSTLRNCLIVNNRNYGLYMNENGGYVDNCTIANNSDRGFYVPICAANRPFRIVNNIFFYNGANGTNNWYSTNISYTNCCLYPTAPGVNNITNAPLFVDTNAGNWRLAANSPCINAGTNVSWTTNSYDLDGRTRIRYGTADMGAYECIYDGTIYKLW